MWPRPARSAATASPIRGLELQLAVEGEAARQVQRRLRVEAAVDDRGHELGLAGRLVVPAHHPEHAGGAAAAAQQAGDDGVHRPLARPDRVRMPGLDPEGPAAAVQQHAGLGVEQAAAEAVEDRVDEGDGIAVAVDDAEIDGVAMLRLGPQRRAAGALRVDPPAQRAQHLLRQQGARVVRQVVGVADQRVAVVIGDLGRLGEQVDAVGLRHLRRQIVAGQHAEDHQRRQPLAVRRALDHLGAVIVEPDRVDPVGDLAAGGEIVERVQPALGLEQADQRLRHRALVEGSGAMGGDVAQPGAELRLGMPVADRRDPAAGQEHGAAAGVAGQEAGILGPVPGDARRHRIALLGIEDGAGEQPVERQRPVLFMQPAPGRDRARHRHRMRAALRDRRQALGRQRLRRGRARGAAAAVQRQRVAPGRGVEHEAVAADAGHVGFGHALHRDRGQRRVDRVAAIHQHLEPRGRGQRMRGGDRRLARDQRRAPRLAEIPLHVPCLFPFEPLVDIGAGGRWQPHLGARRTRSDQDSRGSVKTYMQD